MPIGHPASCDHPIDEPSRQDVKSTRFSPVAEVVKLVDALDSKSSGLYARGGSIPPFGT